MRVKVTIYLLSVFLLWSSLHTPSRHPVLTKKAELKIVSEIVSSGILPDEQFAWKKASAAYYPISEFAKFSLSKITAWHSRLNSSPILAYKNVKSYLLFRVLRH
jgi:hypothetical protein